MPIVEVEAIATGSVWKIEAAPGQSLAERDTILILESMKMEIPVDSPVAGVLCEVLVEEGEVVNEGIVIARIET